MTSWIERLRQKKSLYSPEQGDKSAKSEASVTSGTPSSVVSEVFVTSAQPFVPEVMIVQYQRFFWDYDLPDGTYTPEELRRARIVVKPGPELRYRLRWPRSTPHPITDRTSGRGSAC
jgi:hypothetical protein